MENVHNNTLVNRIISVEVTDDNIQDLIYSTTQSFTSKNQFSANQFYADNFNFVDVFDRKLHEKECHDKMNDWKAVYLWNVIRIGIKNCYALYREFKEITFFEFIEIIANWLLDESLK